MESSDCCRLGMMNECCVDAGRDGCRLIVALWVDETVEPSGSWTWMLLLGCRLVDGAVGWMKWCEQPLSSMAECGGGN